MEKLKWFFRLFFKDKTPKPRLKNITIRQMKLLKKVHK